LANIKSQIKRNRTNEKKRLRNRTFRGAARTAVAQARGSFDEGAPETKDAVLKAISLLDKAANKGVLHPNNAARRKGRLMKRLAKFTPTAPAAAPEKAEPVEEKKGKKAPAKKK
jgi:small subunit ribosomal protein S20